MTIGLSRLWLITACKRQLLAIVLVRPPCWYDLLQEDVQTGLLHVQNCKGCYSDFRDKCKHAHNCSLQSQACNLFCTLHVHLLGTIAVPRVQGCAKNSGETDIENERLAYLFESEGLELAGVYIGTGHSLLLSHSRHATTSHGLPLHPPPRLPPALGGVLTVQTQLALLVGLGLHLDAEEGVAQHAQQVPG